MKIDAARHELERVSKESAKAIYVGGGVSLCRVLGKYKMYVDTRDESIAPCLLMDGIWESWITLVVARLVRSGTRVINVGANVGYYTMLMADLVGPQGYVYAFEPQPRLAELVGRSARANGFYDGRVGVFPWAVGDSHCNVAMSVNPMRNGYAYVRDGKSDKHVVHGGGEDEWVAQATLDECLTTQPNVDFVLMDVEGSEERVWDGMQGLLEKNPRMQLVLEFTPMFLEDPMRFAKKLTSFGHKLVEIGEDGGFEEIAIDALCAKYQTNIALLK